jgi:hypothetical protein
MRRILSILTPIVALWALASFAGTMLDPGHAGFWTQSLMWSLISCMVVAPFFVFVRSQASPAQSTDPSPSSSPSAPQASSTAPPQTEPAADAAEEEPFDDRSKRTLWPKPAAAERESEESVRAEA